MEISSYIVLRFTYIRGLILEMSQSFPIVYKLSPIVGAQQEPGQRIKYLSQRHSFETATLRSQDSTTKPLRPLTTLWELIIPYYYMILQLLDMLYTVRKKGHKIISERFHL